MKTTRTNIAKKIKGTAGRIFSVKFEKADGTIRDMNCRTGVHKNLKGGAKKSHPSHLISVYDIKNSGYRYVNVGTIKEAKIDGKAYTV